MKARILLVDDSGADRSLFRLSLKKHKVDLDLYEAEDGQEALDFLRDDDKLLPHLILLDLNMPGMSGHEVLEVLKKDPELRVIPILILSSSDADFDVKKAYRNHVNGYIRKPLTQEALFKICSHIDGFWMECVVKDPTLV